MQNNITILILGMTLVTFIPRLLPFIIMNKIKFSDNAKSFLNYIPYAAIGALIFPDSFNAVTNTPIASIVGTIAAFILSYFTKNIILVVTVSIAITYGVILLI
jgi:branched-subunit amino acid transport protein